MWRAGKTSAWRHRNGFDLGIHRNQMTPQKFPLPTGPHPLGEACAFTLMELLVVLAIVSVMVGFVGPRLVGSLSNTTLKTASKRVAASLRFARSQAITETRSYEVVFDLDRHQVAIRRGETVSDGAENGGKGEEDKGLATPSYRLPGEVRFEKAIWGGEEGNSGLFRILFLPNGGSSGGELVLRNERGHRYSVTVDAVTGVVKVRSDERYA